MSSELFSGPANLYRGFEGVGGKLTLTAGYLLFKPHAFNIQKEEQIIYLKDILEVKNARNLCIFSNALKVKTKLTEYKFVVKNRNKWIIEIRTQLATIS